MSTPTALSLILNIILLYFLLSIILKLPKIKKEMWKSARKIIILRRGVIRAYYNGYIKGVQNITQEIKKRMEEKDD